MLAAVWPILVVAAEFMLRIGLIGFILLRRPGRPTSNLAWITLILAVPLVGAVGYLMIGEARLGRRRIGRHAAISGRLHPPGVRDVESARALRPEIPAHQASIAALAEAGCGDVAVGGNALQLIAEPDEFITALVADVDAAERHCHLVFYIFLTDRSGEHVSAALIRAAERGVACRLLVDAVGSRPFTQSRLRRKLERAGVRVVEALPANLLRMLFARLDLRNHRKIAVIDGVIGYMGSHNIADAEFAPKPKYAPWIDAMVRAHGPVVQDLQRLFVEDWYLDTDESLEAVLAIEPGAQPDGVAAQILGTGPSAYTEVLRQISLTAFHAAQEELVLTTPYFVPDPATAIALGTAARRGVRTILIVPARNDSPLVAAASRSHYDQLLDAGVQVFEFQKGLLHAKTMTVDRELALVSSANLDRRSFELNFEISLIVYDTDFASRLRFLQTSYLVDSLPVDLARWRRRRWPVQLWQNAAGVLSPLL